MKRIQIYEDDWVTSDRVDPLQSYTSLSNLKLSTDPSNPDYDFDRELQAISTNLKSMAKPHDIDQVVKNILSGSSEVENCNLSQALKDKHVYVSANKVENRERRADLGRKRGRFSMKPDSSQPSVRLEPTVNTKKLKDPEEYFKAYERNENARREIDKQMGAALASDQQNPSSFKRPRRRQGLERESVKTKHLFSSVTNEIGENHISSQETLEPSIPFNQSSQTKSDKIAPMEEMDLTGYKSDDFVEELLSLPTEDLEGDGAERLLRERLHIKSFQPEDCLPEFLDFTLINQKSSKRTLSKPRPLKPRQGAEQSSVDISEKIFDVLKSLEKDGNFEGDVDFEDFTVAFERSKRENLITPGVGCDVDNEEEIGDSRGMSVMSSRVNSDADSMVEGIQEAETEYDATGISFEKLSGTDSQVAHGIMGSDEIQEHNLQQTMPEPNVDKLNDVSIQADIEMNNDEVREQDELHQNGVEKSNDAPSQSGMIVQEQDAVEKSNDAPSQSDQSHSASVEEHLRDGLSRNPEISPDRNNESTEKSGAPLNEPTKAVSPPSKKQKGKEKSRRQSLADQGTSRETGVRQSTRSKTRQSLTDQGTSWENVANSPNKTVEQSYNAPSQSDQSHSASVEEHLRDGLSRNPEISPDKNNETTEEPKVPLNEPTKANSPPIRKQKGKEKSRRQSLADQGTSRETGVRQSTRSKTRQSLTDQGTSWENVANSPNKIVEQSYNAPSQSDQSHSASVEEHLRDGLSRNPEISPDRNNETTEEPTVPLNEPTKANTPPRRKQKGKEKSRRQSLADQGTSWETGVRRSTRFKTRPLEFWRGERLLIARIHKSLPTVIGMKSGNGEGGALIVKSFVDEKYKDLVELVSLH